MMRTISINEARQLGAQPKAPVRQETENEAAEIEVVKQAIKDLQNSLERTSALSGQQVATALAQVTHAVASFSVAVEQVNADNVQALQVLSQALQPQPVEEIKEWTFTVTKRDDNDNIVSFKAVKG